MDNHSPLFGALLIAGVTHHTVCPRHEQLPGSNLARVIPQFRHVGLPQFEIMVDLELLVEVV